MTSTSQMPGPLAGPWPMTAERDADGVLRIGGITVIDLAREHGTPLWVVDEADIRARCREHRDAFPGVDVAYAAKAWCTTGILQIVDEEGLFVDVASAGELHTALNAGIDPAQLIFHGSNKSADELDRALAVGVGRIVIDSFDELDRLQRLAEARDVVAACHLRITPGIDAHTHEYVRTGHDDSKFGFTLSLGLADRAILTARELAHVDVLGIHAHIGSQIFGVDPFVVNAEVALDLLARWRDEYDIVLGEINLGGGMGIAYTHEDRPVGSEQSGAAVLAAVNARCADLGLARPRLLIEPGRAIVGPSTITLYEVGTVKDLPGLTRWVSVDGGMSDNIRPALYEAEHEIDLVSRHSGADPHAVTVVGKHCESGDLVRERGTLPADVAVGDLLAVAATGAYTESMASNYNRLPRPAAVLVADGKVRPLLRRETLDDVIRRDVPLN
ncbi:MAG: diaminopimelate decarboxylase [Nitriliruptoraceae bacterium]